MFKKLWNDDAGIVTIEYLVLGTFLALALIVGVTALAASINSELSELAQAVGTFNQNFTSRGYSHCVATKGGSRAIGDITSAHDIQSGGAGSGITQNINDGPCN
jgi:Flp pilus assembly pilin Flp